MFEIRHPSFGEMFPVGHHDLRYHGGLSQMLYCICLFPLETKGSVVLKENVGWLTGSTFWSVKSPTCVSMCQSIPPPGFPIHNAELTAVLLPINQFSSGE